MKAVFSLLHATYRAGGSAVGVRGLWLERAREPGRVEHIFALDADDEVSVRATESFKRVIGPSRSGEVTAVRNWNAAAEAATGDVLFVIADDLIPPTHWDATLDEILGNLQPRRLAFAVRVADIQPTTDSRPWLMRHPVVSRRFYHLFGLFDPAFTGLFCDDDITLRSFWRAVVLDGSRLLLEHRRDPVRLTASQALINSDAELAHGRRLRDERWGSFRPPARYVFFPRPRWILLARPWAIAWRWQIRARAKMTDARRLLRRVIVATGIRLARVKR